jgi:hypothetical protein
MGFAFVGRQVRFEVDGDEFRIDLLFYHLTLRCYVVIDLKARPFEPEFAGKLNFYLSAVDEQRRHKDDAPTIGLLLVRGKKNRRNIKKFTVRNPTTDAPTKRRRVDTSSASGRPFENRPATLNRLLGLSGEPGAAGLPSVPAAACWLWTVVSAMLLLGG